MPQEPSAQTTSPIGSPEQAMHLIEDLESQLGQLRDWQQQTEQRDGDHDAREAELCEREAALEANLQRALDDVQQERLALRDRRRVIAHRMKRYRTALLETAEGERGADVALRQVGKQRRSLCEVRDLLEHSEHEMVRRWAHHRGIVTACMIMITLSVLAGISYFAASRITAPIWGVSMVIEVPADQWQHRAMSNAVLQQVIDRPPRSSTARNVSDLKSYLQSNVAIEPTGDDRMTLSMRVDDPNAAIALLNAWSETALGPNAPVGPFARGAAQGRVVTPAMRSAMPVEDPRPLWTGRILGALAAATLLLVLICRLIFRRAQRVFNHEMREALAVLNDDDSVDEPSEPGRVGPDTPG